jgi:hypothetical protein
MIGIFTNRLNVAITVLVSPATRDMIEKRAGNFGRATKIHV